MRKLLIFSTTMCLTSLRLPADISKIAAKPWTIFTHMFTHDSIWQLLGNMLWLWVFGYIFLDLTGNRKIIPVYIYGAFAGAVAFVLAYNFLPGLKHISSRCNHTGSIGRGNGNCRCCYHHCTRLPHFPNDNGRHTHLGSDGYLSAH